MYILSSVDAVHSPFSLIVITPARTPANADAVCPTSFGEKYFFATVADGDKPLNVSYNSYTTPAGDLIAMK